MLAYMQNAACFYRSNTDLRSGAISPALCAQFAQACLTAAAKLEEVRAELDHHVRRGQRMGITVLYALLCRALIEQSRADEALDAADQVQKIGRATDQFLFEAEFCRVKALALLISEPLDASTSAQTLLEQALEIARHQDARSIELLVVRDLVLGCNQMIQPIRARPTSRGSVSSQRSESFV